MGQACLIGGHEATIVLIIAWLVFVIFVAFIASLLRDM